MANDWIGQLPSEEGLARKYLVRAFLLSLVIHVASYGAYQVFKGVHWSGYQKFIKFLTPSTSRFTPAILEFFKPKPQKAPLEILKKLVVPELQPKEVPLVFVSVDPATETMEDPKSAKYYSDRNSMAANPQITRESDQPDINGQPRPVIFTRDVPREVVKTPPEPVVRPTPPQPKPPEVKPEPKPEPKPESKPEPQPAPKPEAPQKAEKTPQEEIKPQPKLEPKPLPADSPGELAMARPADLKIPQNQTKEPGTGQDDKKQPERQAAEPLQPVQSTRPRTLAEARMRQQDSPIAGQKTKQEGGVKRRLQFSALDARATPFGAYDAAIVAAIQQRWYDLLDQRKYAGEIMGQVVIEFRLHATGRISDLKVTENTVGELLCYICQAAIMDPSPYPKWPPEMRQHFSGDFREVRFTFYYY